VSLGIFHPIAATEQQTTTSRTSRSVAWVGRTPNRRPGHTSMDSLTVILSEGKIVLDGLLNSGAALAHDCGGTLACST
jgi:ferredoxin